MSSAKQQKWRRFLGLATPVTIICGIIAVVYFFYRAALIAVPTLAFEQHLFHPLGSSAVVCGQQDEDHLKDPARIISAKYQKYIESQTFTPNLVVNPTMVQLDPQSELPVGYNQNIDAPIGTFEYLQDIDDKQLFLRATHKPEGTDRAPSWLIDPVPVKQDHTYAFSFSYRSNVPVRITTESIKGNLSEYHDVVTLKPTGTWQSFTAHFHNASEASAFRVLLVGAQKGYVDSRNFIIREIPDAQLTQGIVTVAFDDGWQSVWKDALPVLKKYNIRTTQYIISEVADKGMQEYMDKGAIKELKRFGHEVGSHSLTHCNQTTLKEAEIKDNATRSKELLEKDGLGPIKSFAYPLGQYNEMTQEIYGREYPLIRTSDFGYNDRYFDESNIQSIGILSSTSDKEFQSWLDHARSRRLWVVLVYHRINESGDYSVTSDQLGRQMKMIAESGLQVMPLSEAADLIR